MGQNLNKFYFKIQRKTQTYENFMPSHGKRGEDKFSLENIFSIFKLGQDERSMQISSKVEM